MSGPWESLALQAERVGEQGALLLAALQPWGLQPTDVREPCVRLTMHLARLAAILADVHEELDA